MPDSNEERMKFLENMNLVSSHRLNLAGLLLFGDKPQFYKPAFILKAVAFAGRSVRDSYLDSEDFEGSLPVIFQGALAFIMRNLHKIQKQKGVNTIGEPEVPQIVFEELLVNALIHRDYFVSAPIRLFIFEDRVEIISPGNLPDHLTIEKICAGNSIQRNPILASFVAKGLLPYRGLGTGVRRALQDWPQTQFIDDRDGCLFTSMVTRIKMQDLMDKDALRVQIEPEDASLNAPLSDLQEQLLDIIRQDSKASYELLMIKLGKDRTTIMRNIQKMKEMGIIRRSGSKKAGSWEIVVTRIKVQDLTDKGALKMQVEPKNAPTNASLSELQEQILKIIRQNSKVSYELLMMKLCKDRTTIMRNIQKLKEMGVIQRSGSKKTGCWEIL